MYENRTFFVTVGPVSEGTVWREIEADTPGYAAMKFFDCVSGVNNYIIVFDTQSRALTKHHVRVVREVVDLE